MVVQMPPRLITAGFPYNVKNYLYVTTPERTIQTQIQNTKVISTAPPTVWPMAHYKNQLTHVSQPYFMDFNKNDFRERLTLSMEQVDVFSSVDSRFQALGAATEKALSPSLRRVRGMM